MAKNFVLGHGAWHGGWCWRRVAEPLRQRGHRVFTPTLTGLGERVHLRAPGNDLEQHVADVGNLLEWEELDRVVLCGHSYAGMIITALADRVPGRIERLVYVDAYLPRHGQCVFDLRPAEQTAELRRRVAADGDGWLMPPTSAEGFGVRRGEDREWLDRRFTAMSVACFEQPISLSGIPGNGIEADYVLAAENPNGAFRRHADELRGAAGWTVHDLPCGHEVMIDEPEALVGILDSY